VQRGAGIGIVLEREPLLIPLIYGIQKAGAAYIPIDPKNPTDRINAIIEESGLELLFSRSIYLNDQIAANCRVLNLDLLESGLVEAAPPLQHVALQPSDLAYIIYTSGSTGKPKGVMIEHRSLSNIIHHLDRHYPLEADGNYLFKTTYAFDVSVAEIYGWFLNGGCLTILPPGAESDPYALLDVIDDYKVTHVNFVPSMFSVFVEAIKNRGVDKIRHLSYAFLAGEALPVELVRQFDGLGVNAVLENIYGPTEGTIYSAGFSTRHLPAGPRVPIGKPLSNLSLYVLDKHQNLQPLGVPGELCIGGAALARGYLNDAKLTNSKFIPHPFVEGERIYRTGDLARWLPTGDIDYLGRIDKQVKIRGFRIELGEIEHQLVAHELIREVVVAVKERAGDKYLAAYYVSEEVLGSKELTDFLIGKLPSYMLPTYFVHLDELPLKANGKLDSKRLPEPALQQQDDYLAPSSEIAQQLAGIWSDILDLDYNRIGVNHTFFELGGHSLKAISVISRIEKEFNVKIRLQTFFNKPTISDLEKNILMTFLSQKPKVNKKTSHKVII
ncbi:MAG: amino acid adenylation domain-containing protein, partial [Bacteroidota bacterium]